MDKNTINTLMHFNTTNASNKKVIINSKYICEFYHPELKEGELYEFFSEWHKDENCPRRSCYADVFVGDDKGRLYINNNYDLSEGNVHTITLVIYKDDKAVLSTIGISCKILDD